MRASVGTFSPMTVSSSPRMYHILYPQVWFLFDFAVTILYVELLIHIKCQRYHPYPKNYCLCTHKVTSLLFVGPGSQTSKDEGRGPGQSGEILGLKRPYDVMEGGISRGLPMRESLSAANCEGKKGLSVNYHVRHNNDVERSLITYYGLKSCCSYSSVSILGLIGRAMPHDRDSPHHTPYKDVHHIRGSISQGGIQLKQRHAILIFLFFFFLTFSMLTCGSM